VGKQQQKLTASMVERLKTPGLYKDEITGLYLRVSDKDAKAWTFRFMLGGKAREMGLGPFPVVKLFDARNKALAARQLLLDGKDPIQARRDKRAQQRLEEAKQVTFKTFATEFIEARRSEWKADRHQTTWERSLEKYVYPLIGDLPVSEIDVNSVLRVIEQKIKGVRFWRAHSPTASRVRERVELILDAATVRGLRAGPNPARWKGNLKHVLSSPSKIHVTKHHDALDYNDVAAFMAELSKSESTIALAFRFLILTAARTGEVCGARCDEIDSENKVWVIPWHRIKKRKQEDGPHRIPLSDAAREIVAIMATRRRPNNPYLFPAIFGNPRNPIGIASIEKMRSRMGYKSKASPHGFRSCFKTWASEQTSFQHMTVEAALSHVGGDKLERAYQRGDLFEKRRDLMQAWGRFATQGPANNVVRLAG
jgi:integrase